MWDPPQKPVGKLQGYEVHYKTMGGRRDSIVAVITGFKWKLTDLKPHIMYVISMRAKSAAGYSDYTMPVTAKTLEDGKIIMCLLILI